MTEEKVVWDIPRYHDCAKCSRDGLLAVHTKEGVTVYVPKFESASLTLSPRWFQLVGTNDLSKEPQPAISAIPATGIECASWLRNSTVSPLDDRINDPNKVCVTQIDWSPPGVGNGRPSLLGVQFSNGIAAVFDFGTNDVHKLELLGCGRQSVALYGLNVAWDVSASLKMESSAKSDAVTRVRSIIAIRWLPHLIQSSSGYIYLLFAIATDDGIISMWKVSELPTTNRSNERSAQSLSGALLLSHKIIEDEGISTVSITSLAISPCAKSDFNASCFTVLVGTAKGYIHYVSVNLEAVSSTAARSYRHFQHPVETMNIFEVETGKNLLVTKSNMKLVVAELGDGGAAKEGPFHQINNEDVHSNLISSVMCVMSADTVKQAGGSTSLWSSHVGAYFPASSYHDTLLSTFISASLDGTIRVWSATRPRSTSSSSSTSLPSERAQRTSNIIPDDESMVLLDVPFVSVVSGYNGSILGLAADPLGLTICRVKAIGPNESGSREVQMNVRLRRPHCDLTHHINPCISPTWVIDASNSKALLSTIIYHGGFVSSIDHSNMLSNENEIGPRSFAGVPHLWLMSVRDVLESMPMERAGVSAEEVGNDGDDSGDEEKTGGGGSVKAPARNMTTPGDEKGGFSLIYRRVDDIRHKILERVIADSVRTIVESCASLASEELSKLATESDYFTVTPPVTPSGSADGSFTGRSELFRIPTDVVCLGRMEQIWRLLHVIVSAAKCLSTSETTRSLCTMASEAMRRQIQFAIVVTSLRRLSLFLAQDELHLELLTTGELSSASSMILVARSLCHNNVRPKSSSSSLEEFVRLVDEVERRIRDKMAGKEPKRSSTVKASKAGGQKRHRDSETKEQCGSSADDVDECALCGSLLTRAVDAATSGEFRYTRCGNQECGALYQRCCVTLRMIGLAEIASCHVRSCSMCDSIAFAGDCTSLVTGGSGGDLQTEDHIFPFSWAWWYRNSPLCPYCGIFMSSQ